jgi:outer membrane protein assembly factor BamE (lipoprotein component of BamABCDE complex)
MNRLKQILNFKERLTANLVLVFLTFSLVGCAGATMSGKSFDPKQVSTIEKGKTTKQEVRSRFGEPISTRPTETGEVWSYYFQSVSFMNENHSLDIDFDRSGIVTDYRYNVKRSLF